MKERGREGGRGQSQLTPSADLCFFSFFRNYEVMEVILFLVFETISWYGTIYMICALYDMHQLSAFHIDVCLN